jgi:hypothetical protein
MKLPEFFIVGSPKCGTNAMFANLSEHPDIFMPEFKEPHYYGSDLKWAVKKILPQKIRPVVASLLKTANKTIAQREPMNEETRKKIIPEFIPEFDRLSKLLDRNLSCWT